MSRPDESRSVPSVCRALAALLALAVLALTNRAADEPGKAAGPTRQEGLERFRKLSPEDRLQRADKAAGARALVAVTRADLDVTIVERGVVEPAEASDVVCRVKAQAGSTVAGTIKFLIEEGSLVKKGQRLVELDDAALRDQLAFARIELEKATADKLVAQEGLKLIEKQNELEVQSAEIKLKRARLALKRYKGKDPDEKEILELTVSLARLSLDTAKLLNASKETSARAEVKAKTAVEEQHGKRKEALDAQLAQCVLRAPQAGVVIFHVPEMTRAGARGGERVVAQGEPVHEGQKLLRVCGLDRYLFIARVHEALIARVQVGRSAHVRIDAFPQRELRGGVTNVATLPSQKDWLSSDVKVYPVQITLADKAPALKPGMSGEVHIEVERRAKVLQVPLSAIVRSGRQTFCFVKVGKGLQERRVTTGARNDLSVEIREGLKEGEQVLHSPRAIAGKAAPGARSKAARPDSPAVLVRSVRPAQAPGRRTFSESFGLTYRDLQQIAALPDVARAVPVRSFPVEARRLQRQVNALVAGTVARYPDVAGLHLAEGRFLDDEDERWTRNVAVLGADVADRLFPEEEPQGAVVRLGGSGYRVVGVLAEQDRPAGNHSADEVNRSVYIPLRTCRARFGETVVVRRAAAITRETVPLTEVLVDLRPPGQAQHVAECIETLLEDSHLRKDWDVRVAGPVTRAAPPR
jgi:multidrug resistance efflux pump